MWAIRRASIHLKNRVLSSGTSVRNVKSEIANRFFENINAEMIESQEKLLEALMCSRRFCNEIIPSESYPKARTFSSQSSGTHEDSSPLHETRQDAFEEAIGDEMEGELISESELIPGESFAEDDAMEEKYQKITAPGGMTNAILADTRLPVSCILEKWSRAGNKVTAAEVSMNILYFRKRRMFSHALQLSEWLGSSKLVEFTGRNYASQVDLIAKVRGLIEAENFIQQQVPESLRTEGVYRALLANVVNAIDVNKAEGLFNKMMDLFPLSCFSCDLMLLLYKRTNKGKMADILLLMKNQNIKCSTFTYQTLINAKHGSGHIRGMERILEDMKSDGLKPTKQILASVAKNYVTAGLKEKALAVLKEIEGGNLTEKRWVCRFLLPIYASLERGEEVERIWKNCESDPDMAECVAGIQAWGRLNRVKEAEAVFDQFLRIVKRPSSRHYAFMLNMYADHKMLAEGENLVSKMMESGVKIMPPVLYALAKLYARAGEIGKAETLLQKALGGRRGMQLISSFSSILDAYADKGDIQNAERIFVKMKGAGLTPSTRTYRSLLWAYVNAKDPAYGFRERMQADNIFLDHKLIALLARVNKFKAATETGDGSSL